MRYFYHPESDCAFEDMDYPGSGEVDELDETEYLVIKARQKETTVSDEFDCEAMTAYYLKCKGVVAAMNADNKKRIKPVEAEMERVAALMDEYLTTHKVKNASTKAGVFFREMDIKPRATDWTAFYAWIKENDAFEFLHKRITADAVAAYMEQHKDDEVALPPGVAVEKSYVVRVRTGKES